MKIAKKWEKHIEIFQNYIIEAAQFPSNSFQWHILSFEMCAKAELYNMHQMKAFH